MAIDGYFISKLVNEVNNEILNARLERIMQIETDIFVFQFYFQKKRTFLYFKLNAPNASFFTASSLISEDYQQSNLLNSLKQNLEGYILTSISQHSLDRVIEFNFTGNDFLDGKVNKKIIVELMGRHNNLILLDDNNTIIDAFHKKLDPNGRSILPKANFTYFPTSKTLFDDNYVNIDSSKNLSLNYLGISPLLAKYLFVNRPSNILTLEVKPTFNNITNQFYWFNLFEETDDLKEYQSISEMLLILVSQKKKSNNQYINFITKEITKNQRLLENAKNNLSKAFNNLNYKESGDAIYSSGLNLNQYHTSITDYSNNQIDLDVKLNLNQNAQKFYKLYQKAKRSIDHLDDQIKQLENDQDVLNQLLYDINSVDYNFLEIEEILIPYGFKNKKQRKNTKKKIKIVPLKFEYKDYIFYVGKNNLQNEYVTHTLAKNNDHWFHIKDAPGSHVILKGALTTESIEIGAMLAAKYSKQALNPIITVNYTNIKDVKKIPGLKGYNVILKKYQTINIKIDNDIINDLLLHTI